MPDSPATHAVDRARRARIIIIVLVTGVAWACLPFLAGLLGAVVLSVIATPIHRLIAPKMGERRSALLITFVFALVLAAPVMLLLSMSIRQAPMALQGVLESAAFARLSGLRVGEMDVGAQIADIARNMVTWGSSRAMAAAGSFTRVVLNLLLSLVGLYYLLPNRTDLWRRARAFIPFSHEGSERLAEKFASITQASNRVGSAGGRESDHQPDRLAWVGRRLCAGAEGKCAQDERRGEAQGFHGKSLVGI